MTLKPAPYFTLARRQSSSYKAVVLLDDMMRIDNDLLRLLKLYSMKLYCSNQIMIFFEILRITIRACLINFNCLCVIYSMCLKYFPEVFIKKFNVQIFSPQDSQISQIMCNMKAYESNNCTRTIEQLKSSKKAYVNILIVF